MPEVEIGEPRTYADMPPTREGAVTVAQDLEAAVQRMAGE